MPFHGIGTGFVESKPQSLSRHLSNSKNYRNHPDDRLSDSCGRRQISSFHGGEGPPGLNCWPNIRSCRCWADVICNPVQQILRGCAIVSSDCIGLFLDDGIFGGGCSSRLCRRLRNQCVDQSVQSLVVQGGRKLAGALRPF